ncbi:hypothetical protein [Natrinema sp. 1APR25-10V2]|uniref:DUF7344 domain-containing protein n=1 Tax=Natrinema sp. 1APR25-10V2 TaxID=2951081 RepID=UPI002875503F|nr:hypothetical protein [Natrinema sp. 1APR25-10V2]MDS0476925.1 hypothetical protein [Natrinema sp. 1APR25-10V2]
MKTDAIDPDGIGADSPEIEPTTMFEVLSHKHRQCLLQYLAHKPAAVPLGDVAEYIAVREEVTTRDRYERILTGLSHLHLPQLIDAGVITYDDEHKTVQLLVEDDLDPYLRLLSADS